MTLVQMKCPDHEAESIQQPQTTHTEDDFLFEPVALVAAIKAIGDGLVRKVVVIEVGVKKENGNLMPKRTGQNVKPWSDPYGAAILLDGDHRVKRGGPVGRIPRVFPIYLAALGIDFLPEVTLPADECDEHDWQPEIRTRARGIRRCRIPCRGW